MNPPPRSRQQRLRDVHQRLEHDTDAWVATADEGGVPYLVPLSFLWHDDTLLVATAATSPTGRNLEKTGRARLGIGHTRDVVVVDATTVETLEPTAVTNNLGDAFAAKTGFDPRERTDTFRYFRLRPHRVQAWREVNELADRDLMRDGRWTVDGDPAVAGSDTDERVVAGDTLLSVSGDVDYRLIPVGRIASPLTDRDTAPRQNDEGAPRARVVFDHAVREAAAGLRVGDRVIIVTWLHQAGRDVLSVHPRHDTSRPREGVFTTRSPDRPNPIGLHTVTVIDREPDAITVDKLEAIDGTPVLDVKPVLRAIRER